MNRTKLKDFGKRAVAMCLTVLLAISFIFTTFGVQTLADAVKAVEDALIEEIVIESIEIKVAPLNARTIEQVNFAKQEARAYPKDGVDTFRVSLVINGVDYAGKEKPAGLTLPCDVTFTYRTYDLSAISSTGDYVAVSGTYTFSAGTDTLYYDVDVTVNPTTFGLSRVNKYSENSVSRDGRGDQEIYYDEFIDPLSAEKYEDTPYQTRTFGFEIYDVLGASVYHTADSKTGTNTYYDYAIGSLPVNHYLPFLYMHGYYSLFYYYSYQEESLGNISMTRDSGTIAKCYVKQLNYGRTISNDVIQTGLGHFYVKFTGYCQGPDLSQRNSFVGLVYDGYENATSITNKEKMLQLKRGVVTFEIDGYPTNDFINSSWYRNKTLYDKYHEKSYYYCKYGTVEWDGDTYQFEQCRCSNYTHSREASAEVLYKVEGDPEWIGILAGRYKYGDGRTFSKAKLELHPRDDSPVQIVNTYIEDTSKNVKTENDKLRIMIRFNEPVQVDAKRQPELICGLNSANITAADADNAIHFKYEMGGGSDTLVFYYDLKNLPDTALVDQIQIYYITNADMVMDFSSLEDMHITSLKESTRNIYGNIDIKNNIITKSDESRFTLARTYKGASDLASAPILVGPITLKLTKKIDARQPQVVNITDNNKGKTVAEHQVTIELNVEGIDGTVYAHWTPNLNGSEDTEIPRPTSYSANEIITNKNNSKRYVVTGRSEGTVYLWIRVETAFGKVDERLCGPFYFDSSADGVSDIHVVDGTLSSQSKIKTIEFTVDHTGDYLSCAGNNVFDSTVNSEIKYIAGNNELSELYLVYGTDAVWSAGSDLTSKLLYTTKNNARKLTSKVTATKVDYVYKFGFSSTSIANDTSAQTTEQFIDKNNDGSSKQVTYITKVTYRIDIGYDELKNINDFDLDEDNEYKQVFFGFKTVDASGNTKVPTAKNFIAGEDYINDEYALFDIRSIRSADIQYSGVSSAMPTDKITKSSIDQTVNVFPTIEPLVVTFRFSEISRLVKTEVKDTSNYQIKAWIKKGNSTIVSNPDTDCSEHALATWGEQYQVNQVVKDGVFVSDGSATVDGDGNPITQYTSWFSWTLSEEENGSTFRSITLTTYTPSDVSDLCGYYEVYFSFQDAQGYITYTPSATFYIGNNENETPNVAEMKEGKVFTNKVFQFPEETRYYYQTVDGVIQNPYYVDGGGKMTFSSDLVAEKYIRFMEYQDLYLYQIPDAETADSLNQKSGNKKRSEADINNGQKAVVGQWWIRYKMETWYPGNTENSDAWIYYFYSDSAATPMIDLDNLPADLNVAINAVVETIMSSGTTVLLAGEENLDKYGSPKISTDCIKYDSISVEESICTRLDTTILKYESLFSQTVSYQGDANIYDASVLVDDKNVTKEYSLVSNALLTVTGNTRLYITPSDGSYAGIWGQMTTGKNMLLKDAIDTVYRQILISAGNDPTKLGNLSAPSGRYTVFEVSDNGYATFEAYIDKTAPQINFDYTVFDEDGKTFVSSKHYTRGNENGLVIHGTSFTLRGIGYYGAVGTYEEEIDKDAYVVVYNSSRTKVLHAMTVEDLRLTNPILNEEGIYHVEVWDRSGNSYSFSIELVKTVMKVTAKAEDSGVIVKVQYRDESQISLFEVKRDGVTIDTKFAKSKLYSENGTYTIRIVDRFGIEYVSEKIKYAREIPPITWRATQDNKVVGDGTVSATTADATQYARTVFVNSVTYNVVTSVPLSFRFSTASGIKVEFLNGATEDDFNITPSQYTTYAQKELFNFQVKCSYEDHPNVYVIYNVIVDTVAPTIDVEYDHYSFESHAQYDASLQLFENPENYEVGQIITPNRIDFALVSATTLRVSAGASVFTNEARLNLNDNSGIHRMVISRDDKVVYDGEYRTDGQYVQKDGEIVNYNVITEYGKYTITAYDVLGNRSVFSFTNTPSNSVVYSVDGKIYEPYYDYVYETDVDGKVILDEDGNPIVISKWLFLEKFKVDENQTVDGKYFDTSTKESLGNFFRYDQEYTYVQYGNQAQTITVSTGSDVQFLLTYDDTILAQENNVEVLKTVTCHRFIGFQVENGAIYLYHYVVDNDDGEISVGEDVLSNPVATVTETLTGNTKVIYSFDSEIENGFSRIGMYITATFQKDGKVVLELNAPTDSSMIVTSEVKVQQIDGSFEPSYHKTVLSLYESYVDVYNENGKIQIVEEDLGVGQWKYCNGEKLFVDVESNTDPYLTAVMISYSKTMVPGVYHYLFATDPSVVTEEFFGQGDGYYFIKTVNVFGNEKIYRLAVSNSLLVSTVADYADGWQKQFATDETVDINANKSVTVSFRQDGYITYVVTKNGLVIPTEQDENGGSVTLVFDEEGQYTVTVKDQYGNVVKRNIGIKEKELNLPSNMILNPQTKALRYTENYTNMKVSVNQSLLGQYDIHYVAVEKGKEVLVLFDEISSSTERVAEQEGIFSECVGLSGDGDYTVVFRDGYGNKATILVHYRETPTLKLSRMTSLSEKAESFAIEDALNPEINFISNNSLIFNSDSEQCVFMVDHHEKTFPYAISFANSETTGRMASTIEYIDEYGFSYQFTAVLYRTNIQLELDPSVYATTVNGVLMTSDNIRVLCSEGASCYYQLSGGDYVDFPSSGVLKKDGNYVIFAKDIAGNYSYFTITKDSVAEYSFREGKFGNKIENGMITNSDNVLFQAENSDSSYIKKAFLNGEKVAEGSGFNFQKNGKWEIVVADQTGNESLFCFYVYTHEINYLNYFEPKDYSFSDVWYTATGTGRVSMNSGITVEDDGTAHIVFDRAGTYSVVMSSDVTGTTTNFTVEISEEVPTATLKGTENGGSTIESVSVVNTKKNDTVYVYHNGSNVPTVYEIAYDGEKVEISEEGDYVVVVKNLAQNAVTYNFTKKHVANTAGSVLIILLMVVIVIGLFAGMTYRNKSKVDK